MTTVWDPYDPVTCEDPYPVYARLRADDRWHRTMWGTLAVTRFDDCLEALHDPRLGNDPRGSDEHRALLEQPLISATADDFELAGFMFRDPPEHTCRRGAVARGFTPAAVARWHEPLEEIVEALTDQVVARGHIDIVNELGPALQTAVMSVVLGLPHEGMGQLRDWRIASLIAKEAAMARAGDEFEAAAPTGPDAPEQPGDPDDPLTWWAQRQAARRGVLAYLGRRIERRRRAPRDDTLTMIARALDDGRGGLDLMDGALIAEQLVIAGFETMTYLLGNTIAAALAHPPVWEAMAAGDVEPDAVVAEALRWDGPVQVVSRFARQDTAIGGHPIAAGAHVHVLLGAANRDERRFADADRFDTARGEDGLAFSHGRHRCLAAHLARLEAARLLGALSRRAPDLHLVDDRPAHRPDLVLRGHRALVATWSRRSNSAVVTGSKERKTAGREDP